LNVHHFVDTSIYEFFDCAGAADIDFLELEVLRDKRNFLDSSDKNGVRR